MILTSPTGANSNYTAFPDQHRHHWRIACGAGRSTDKFVVTLGTEEVDDGIGGDFIFGFNIVTSI